MTDKPPYRVVFNPATKSTEVWHGDTQLRGLMGIEMVCDATTNFQWRAKLLIRPNEIDITTLDSVAVEYAALGSVPGRDVFGEFGTTGPVIPERTTIGSIGLDLFANTTSLEEDLSRALEKANALRDVMNDIKGTSARPVD